MAQQRRTCAGISVSISLDLGRSVSAEPPAALRLAHVVAGGRLWGYTDVADRMSAHEYVALVVKGELHDRVLSSQLRAGFAVRNLLAGYLHDWRSRHFATLLEWMNPDHFANDRPARIECPRATPD
jgi:hypothetical protein